MPTFGQWRYKVDREATINAYAKADSNHTSRCGCIYCRNFERVRTIIFPQDFRTLIETLGIDYNKEAEAYHNARLATGLHDYGGWFHFVGTLDETGDFAPVDFGSGFTAWMLQAHAPRLSPLKGLSVVELGFHSDAVPWLLDEPEPDF